MIYFLTRNALCQKFLKLDADLRSTIIKVMHAHLQFFTNSQPKNGPLLQTNQISHINTSLKAKRRVKFWKDRWCDNELLCDSFPSLFALASSKEAWVADLWNQSNFSGY